MRKRLDFTIALLGLLFVFLVINKAGLTGAVIGVNSLSNGVYLPIVLIIAISLITLMSFRKWIAGGLAALALGGAAVGVNKYISKNDKEFSERQERIAIEEFGDSRGQGVKFEYPHPVALQEGWGTVYAVHGLDGKKSIGFYVDDKGKLVGVRNVKGNEAILNKDYISDPKELQAYQKDFKRVTEGIDKLFGKVSK